MTTVAVGWDIRGITCAPPHHSDWVPGASARERHRHPQPAASRRTGEANRMELEFQDDRRRGRIVMGLGLVLAIVAGGAAYYAVSQAQVQSGQAALLRVPVVVATTLIPARQAIKEDQVVVRQVPIDDTNLNGVATEVSQVVGRIPAVSILQGQLVTSNMLASSAENSQFSILGPGETVAPNSEHWRAVAITVPDDLAVGGLL